MHVTAILQSKGSQVHTVTPSTTLEQAVRQLAERRVGALIVSADGKTADGILSERDIVRVLAERGPGALGETAQKHMSGPVITCAPEDTIAHLMQQMTEHRIRHLPVIENGVLTGVISIGDVVKRRIEEIEKEADEMRTIISGG